MSDAKQTTKQSAKPAAKQTKTTAKQTETTTKDQPVTQTRGTAENPDAVVRNFRKTRVGLVVSDKMDKTVVVAVEDRVQHALYGKILRRTNKLKAHDENNDAGIGDRVLIMETRPQSATKRWRLVEIVERAR